MPQTKVRFLPRPVVVLLTLGMFLISPSGALAHPMGNFTINHYSGIHLENGWVGIRYFIDMAEIPTFQELQGKGLNGRLDDPKLQDYLSAKAQAFLRGLRLT